MSEDTAIVEVRSEHRLGIIPAKTPHDVIVQASAIAKELATIIDANHLALNIQGRKFVRVEGWSTMGAMLGVLPREVSVQRLEDGSYEAVVELVRITDSAIIGRASASVGMDETWGKRAEYARRSMAITRATGKAYRMGFSWIIGLAGFETTPAEEIDTVDGEFHETGKTEQVKKANGNGGRAEQKVHPIFQAWIENKVVENAFEAANVNGKYLKLDLDKTALDEAVKIGKLYRSWRDAGQEPAEAAKKTLAGELPK